MIDLRTVMGDFVKAVENSTIKHCGCYGNIDCRRCPLYYMNHDSKYLMKCEGEQ